MMKGQSKERVLKQSQGRENNAKRWGKGYQFEAQETSEKGGKNNAERKRKPVHAYYPCKTVIWWVARVLGQLQAR